MNDNPYPSALVLSIAPSLTPEPMRGRDVAEANADPGWALIAMTAIAQMARTGRPFEAYSLVAELGIPEPDMPNRWGAIFARAHREGLIRRVGAVQSSRRTTAKSLTTLWRGNADYFESAIPVAPRRAGRCVRPTRNSPRSATQ